MNPEALNTGDSDLSRTAAYSHQGPEEKRCGEHNAFALRCAGRLTLALQAVVDPLVTNKSPGQSDKSRQSLPRHAR